MDDRKVMI